MIPAIIVAEKRGKMRAVLLSAIVLLLLVQAGFVMGVTAAWVAGLWLTVFFVGFNILEATLPSLISRIAPPDVKGAAMGLYNTVQSIGLFAGGAVGGMIAKFGGAVAVHIACAVLGILWLALMLSMPFPAPRKTPLPATNS